MLYQMTSDAFFRQYSIRDVFPQGVDLSFLDGMHRLEYLLRDFAYAEAASRRGGLILLHDCLPTNYRMAERAMQVDESEDKSTRYAWTGDVWRILPTLKRYRPDLRVLLLDCGQTGLVACRNLNPSSTTLLDSGAEIVDTMMESSLEDFGLDSLRELYPLIDTRKLQRSPEDLTALLGLG